MPSNVVFQAHGASGYGHRRHVHIFVLSSLLAVLFGLAIIAKILLDMGSHALYMQTLQVSTPSCGIWKSIIGPGLGGYNAGITDIAVVSPDNVWAVGTRRTSTPPLPVPFINKPPTVDIGPDQPLILHWDGANWQSQTIPGLMANRSYSLSGVYVISANDLWVIGSTMSTAQPNGYNIIAERTFAAHWDGSNWQTVGTPNPGTFGNFLTDITAISADNIWAIGYYEDANLNTHPMIMRWDGKSWELEQVALPGDSKGMLFNIATVAPDQIWAVGKHQRNNSNNEEYEPLVLQRVGTQWNVMPVPPLPSSGKGQSALRYISAISANAPDNIWIVGVSSDNQSVTMRWDGSGWQVIPVPLDKFTFLDKVVVLAKNDAWAVGSSRRGPGVVLRWDGNGWSAMDHPIQAPVESFTAIAVTPSDAATSTGRSVLKIWVAGAALEYEDGPVYAMLAEFTGSPCHDQVHSLMYAHAR